MKKLAFGVFLSLLPLWLPSSRAAESRKNLRDYWREVALPFTLFEKRANPVGCYKDFSHFRGCVEGLNTVLGATQPPLVLSPEGTSPLAMGKLRQEFGLVKVRELSEADLAAGRRAEETRRAWEALFRLGPGKVDFPAICRWFRQGFLTPQNESEMTAVALNGYLALRADPHSRLMPSRYLKDQRSWAGRPFIGVGITLKQRKNGVVVQQVLPRSPAAEARLAVNDVIAQIDSDAFGPGAVLEDVSRRLEGTEGSAVTLQIRRRDQILSFRLIRRRLEARPLEARTILREGRKLGYIRLQDFAHRMACDEVRAALSQLTTEGVKGFLLDLRDNPGGLIAEAVCVANLFLEPGRKVVSVKALPPASGVQVWTTSEPRMTSLPLVLMVNAASASSAEVVAGALQDYGRATVVGSRTYGKGSVQDDVPWQEAKGVDYLRTMGRCYRPLGGAIQLVGIDPDWAASTQPHPSEDDALDLREVDRYPNALPAEAGPDAKAASASPSRQALVSCVKANGQAEKRFDPSADYQELVAEDILACQPEAGTATGT